MSIPLDFLQFRTQINHTEIANMRQQSRTGCPTLFTFTPTKEETQRLPTLVCYLDVDGWWTNLNIYIGRFSSVLSCYSCAMQHGLANCSDNPRKHKRSTTRKYLESEGQQGPRSRCRVATTYKWHAGCMRHGLLLAAPSCSFSPWNATHLFSPGLAQEGQDLP